MGPATQGTWERVHMNSLKTAHNSAIPTEEGEKENRLTASGHGASFGGEENVLQLDLGDGCTTLGIH